MSESFEVIVRSPVDCARASFETFEGAVQFASDMFYRCSGRDYDCIIDAPSRRYTLDELIHLIRTL